MEICCSYQHKTIPAFAKYSKETEMLDEPKPRKRIMAERTPEKFEEDFEVVKQKRVLEDPSLADAKLDVCEGP